MQTLILSCNTGAGHNSCAQAVQEAYHSRGEICNITDSLQFISEKHPRLFLICIPEFTAMLQGFLMLGISVRNLTKIFFVRERRSISYFPPAQSGCINTSALQATIILSVLMYSQPWR